MSSNKSHTIAQMIYKALRPVRGIGRGRHEFRTRAPFRQAWRSTLRVAVVSRLTV